MAFSLTELEAQSAAVLPARHTMRRGNGGAFNNNLNTSSGDIFVVAFNGAQANVHDGACNLNTASAAQSITIAPSTTGGVYVGPPLP